jgi:tetratricopeptide (TPR) repeat protein
MRTAVLQTISVLSCLALVVVRLSAGESEQAEKAAAKEKEDAIVKRRVDQIVAGLGAEEFAERLAAQERLVAMGPGILLILENLPAHSDPEIDAGLRQVRRVLRKAAYGKNAELLMQLLALVAENPDNYEARNRLGWLYYYNLGELELATQHFAEVIEAANAGVEVRARSFDGLAEVYRHKGEIDKAIELHEKGLALLPNAGGFHNLAWMYNTHRKDFKKAIELCNKALELDPRYQYCKISKAVFLANDGQLKSAAEIIEGADLSDPISHYNVACYYAVTGRKETALKYLRTYLYEYHVVVKKRNEMRELMLKDWHLESLRKDSRFVELMKADEIPAAESESAKK